MKVTCKNNNISALDSQLHQYAFDQDEEGDIDITPGKSYDVYGVKKNSLGIFYLVLTDELNSETPWWMPAGLYDIEDPLQPRGWIKKERDYEEGKLVVSSYPIYFDAEEDIEDGTERGLQIFSQMKALNAS